jgi:hypothetical protein
MFHNSIPFSGNYVSQSDFAVGTWHLAAWPPALAHGNDDMTGAYCATVSLYLYVIVPQVTHRAVRHWAADGHSTWRPWCPCGPKRQPNRHSDTGPKAPSPKELEALKLHSDKQTVCTFATFSHFYSNPYSDKFTKVQM